MHGYITQQPLQQHAFNPIQFEGAARIQSPPSKLQLHGDGDYPQDDTMRSKILLYQRPNPMAYNHQESSGLSSAVSNPGFSRLNSNYCKDVRNARFQGTASSNADQCMAPLWSRKMHQEVQSQAATSANTQNVLQLVQRRSVPNASSLFGQS